MENNIDTPKAEKRIPRAPIPETKIKVVNEQDYKKEAQAKQIEMVKTYSTNLIVSQLKSSRISLEFRAALENELKERRPL